MKKITSILTVALLLAFVPMVHADQHNVPDEKPMAEQTQKMHAQMQKMQAQMQEIKATKDPAKRRELMREHRQSMHEGMMMMGNMGNMGNMGKGQGMMSGGAGSKGAMHDMACKDDDRQCLRMQAMEERQSAMQDRMQMMQQMMQQMMEHQAMQSEDQQ
jgi:hypothetical protein